MSNLHRACRMTCALIAALGSSALAAQTYPSRPVRLIVSFSPGSGSDAIGRILASALSSTLGQQVVVENRAGASGSTGAELAAKAAPDGYSILLVNMAHAATALLYKNRDYDLLRDFAPVTQVASAPSVVVVHPVVRAKTLAELVALARGRPGDVAYSSGGVGTPTFLAGELFKQRAGVRLLHVPYRSGGEAITAVLTGEVSVYFAPVATALPNIRQEKLRALAVTSSERVALLGDCPTVAELGYPGFRAGNWYGLAVPAKTSAEIIAAIRGATLNALGMAKTRQALLGLGYVLIGDEPEDFGAHIKSDIENLTRILRKLHMRFHTGEEQ
ncbi:MAG: tripartite tricarboxylate transporter substrate binding protein [Burkholderiales bacterium]|nr:tripartite tricarboxylate transporter substrate binding protein [Burkholderiales bacterium]